MQTNGATASALNGLATLNLESSGSVIGTAVFNYSKVGDDMVFDQPDQVNDWINSFNVDIDGFELTLNNIVIAIPPGMSRLISVSDSVIGRQIGYQSFNLSNNGGDGGLTVTQGPL